MAGALNRPEMSTHVSGAQNQAISRSQIDHFMMFLCVRPKGLLTQGMPSALRCLGQDGSSRPHWGRNQDSVYIRTLGQLSKELLDTPISSDFTRPSRRGIADPFDRCTGNRSAERRVGKE